MACKSYLSVFRREFTWIFKREHTVETSYNKEYEQYYIYALEQFLINTYGYTEYDAKVKVMQDFDEVKEDFEMKEKWICESFNWSNYEYWRDTD